MPALMINNNRTGIDIETADTFLKKLIGLIGKKGLSNKGLMIPSCSSIHTFFMRFSIDILFLDKTGKVIKLIEGLHPYRITLPVLSVKNVIELPEGTIKRLNIKTGDIIGSN
jgi:uncharacterized membrane protein (UPF0127 family)